MIKQTANWLSRIAVAPYVLTYWGVAAVVGGERTFPGYSQMLSLIPGFSGAYLRRAFYSAVLPACGADSHVSFGTTFSHPTVAIGARTYIGIGCQIGDVSIGEDVLIGSHVSIINGSRQHGTARMDIPIREQPGEYPRIVIGRDVWIGDRALVMADVGEQAIVGAGSVVTRAIPPRAIAVGNPARVIRFRDHVLSGETSSDSGSDGESCHRISGINGIS